MGMMFECSGGNMFDIDDIAYIDCAEVGYHRTWRVALKSHVGVIHEPSKKGIVATMLFGEDDIESQKYTFFLIDDKDYSRLKQTLKRAGKLIDG